MGNTHKCITSTPFLMKYIEIPGFLEAWLSDLFWVPDLGALKISGIGNDGSKVTGYWKKAFPVAMSVASSNKTPGWRFPEMGVPPNHPF